jgi:predicted small secreted protein
MKRKVIQSIVLLALVSALLSSCSQGLYGKGRQKCGCPSHRGMVG